MTTTDRLRALLAEATPGPWTIDRGSIAWMIRERPDGPQVANAIIEDDAALIVAAVDALPALLEFVAIAKRAVTMFHGCDRHPGEWTMCDYGDCPAYRDALAKLDGEPNPR